MREKLLPKWLGAAFFERSHKAESRSVTIINRGPGEKLMVFSRISICLGEPAVRRRQKRKRLPVDRFPQVCPLIYRQKYTSDTIAHNVPDVIDRAKHSPEHRICYTQPFNQMKSLR